MFIFYSLLKPQNKLERASIVIALIVFSVALATLAGSIKMIQYDEQLNTQDAELSLAQLNYEQKIQSMSQYENAIIKDNAQIEEQINELSAKIANRSPIINEIIVTLPPEIIYEELGYEYIDEEDEEDEEREYEEDD